MKTDIQGLMFHLGFIEAIEKLTKEYQLGGPREGSCPLCGVMYGIRGFNFSCKGYCPWYIFEGMSCEDWLWAREEKGSWLNVRYRPQSYPEIMEERLRMLAEWHQAMLTGEVIYGL